MPEQTDEQKAKAAAEKAAKEAESAKALADKQAAEKAKADADELARLRTEFARLSQQRTNQGAVLDTDADDDDEDAPEPVQAQGRAAKVIGLITVDHTGKRVG